MVQLIVKALLVVKGFTQTVGLNYFLNLQPYCKNHHHSHSFIFRPVCFGFFF